MPSRDEVATTVREVFETTLKVEPSKLRDEAKLQDDLSLDSLDMVEVVYELEERFDVQIPEEKIEEIHTFGQVVDGLHSAVEAKS